MFVKYYLMFIVNFLMKCACALLPQLFLLFERLYFDPHSVPVIKYHGPKKQEEDPAADAKIVCAAIIAVFPKVIYPMNQV